MKTYQIHVRKVEDVNLKDNSLCAENVIQVLKDLDDGLSAVDSKISAVDDKISAIDDKISAVDDKISAVDSRVSSIDSKISSVDFNENIQMLQDVDNRLSALDFDEDAVASLESLAEKIKSIINQFGGGVEPPTVEIVIETDGCTISVLGESLKKDLNKDMEIDWGE